MGSASNLNLENSSLLLTHEDGLKNFDIEPTPYTFTKVENGRKIIIDTLTLAPPRWLLLDHAIAVIWLMFSSNALLHQLNISDLKLAHEFLKEIRNSKGENPPDVKTCLKEIQDRLIYLYARLTNCKEDYERDQIVGNLKTNSSKLYSKQLDIMSLVTSLSPSKTTVKLEHPLYHEQSISDLTAASPKSKMFGVNHGKKTLPLISKNSIVFEDVERFDDQEIKKYVLCYFGEENTEEESQFRSGAKSLIPTKKNTPPKETAPKQIHCVAEMKSLKYQQSMKVQDMNGQEAAYADLKAEIKKMTINPNVTKDELKDYLKEWRNEQMDKLRNDLKRLNSIEE